MEFALKISVQSKLVISAGVIASASAIWHLLCIFGELSCFVFVRAPQQVIESAQQGTMLSPISTVFVASLMFACTVFSFSAAGLIRKVPLLKSALITIALLCMLCGLIVISTLATSTGLDIWQIVASTVLFYVGICFLAGNIEQYKLVKSVT